MMSQAYLMPVMVWPSEQNARPKGRVPYAGLWSCVEYAKWWYGRTGTVWGDARVLRPNTTDPASAELVLTYEGLGHVAVKLSITATGSLDIWEGNWTYGAETHRQIPIGDKKIRGYIDLDLPDTTWKSTATLALMGRTASSTPQAIR